MTTQAAQRVVAWLDADPYRATARDLDPDELIRLIENPWGSDISYSAQTTLALRLLCALGDGFPPERDKALGESLRHGLPRVTSARVADLLEILMVLPGGRWERALEALRVGARDDLIIEVSGDGVVPEDADEIIALLGERLPEEVRSSEEEAHRAVWEVFLRRAQGLTFDSSRLFALAAIVRRGLGLAEPPEAWDEHVGEALRRHVHRLEPWYVDVFAWWPSERRQALVRGVSNPEVWPLLALDPSPEALDQVMTWLGELPSYAINGRLRECVAPLAPHLKSRLERELVEGERLTHIRHVVLETLAPVADAESAPALLAMFGDGRQVNRRAATDALAALGPEVALADVVEALGAGRKVVRASAVAVLAHWLPEATVAEVVRPALAEMKKDGARAELERLLDGEGRPRGEGVALLQAQLAELDPDAYDRFVQERGEERSTREALLDALPGFDGLLVVLQGLQLPYNTLYGAEVSLWGLWRAVLERERRHPLAPAAALLALDTIHAGDRGAELSDAAELFGERLREPASALCRDRLFGGRAWLYPAVCQRPALADPALHRHLARDAAATIRAAAAGALAEALPLEEALQLAEALLKERRADPRHGGALLLKALAAAEAVPLIERRLARERAKAVKEALEEARRWCDPHLRSPVEALPSEFGAYDADAPFDVNRGLAELRQLLHDAPTRVAWMRLCNLLDRFGRRGGLEVALDYARQSGVEGWPANLRVPPWSWRGAEALLALCPKGAAPLPHTTTVETLMDPERAAAFLTEQMAHFDDSRFKRRFDLGLAPIFVRWVVRGWAWCEEHGVPIEGLEVRVDGGSTGPSYIGRASVAALELSDGFGATYHLTKLLREKEGMGREGGLHRLRVRVPSKHPAREVVGMGNRARFFDLLEALEIPDADRGAPVR